MHFMPLKSYHTESNVLLTSCLPLFTLQSSLSSSAGSTADRPFSLNPSTGRDETANIYSVPELRPEPRKSHGSVRDNKKHASVNYRPKKTVYKWSVYELQHKSSDTATVSNYAAMNGQSLSTMWGEWTSAGEESWVTLEVRKLNKWESRYHSDFSFVLIKLLLYFPTWGGRW